MVELLSMEMAQLLLSGALAGVAYAGAGFVRNKAENSKEKLDAREAGSFVVLSALVGGALALASPEAGVASWGQALTSGGAAVVLKRLWDAFRARFLE